MAKEIRLPLLGKTMEEAAIIACLVKLDAEVKKGDFLFEIETDKATLEMESPADGFVKHILVKPGQTVPVGSPLLVLGADDEDVPKSFIDSLKAAPVLVKPVESQVVSEVEPQSQIKIRETIPLTKKQKLTADRMLKSKREIPCFYLTVRADVTDLVQLRAKLNETDAPSSAVASAKADAKISYNDFLIKAVAIGLQKYPLMTGQLAGDAVKIPDTINIGLAVAAPDGLVVPVVKDTQKKTVLQIAADSALLIEKAQAGKLLLTDLEGACITISNLGPFGVISFIPIVIPGQSSILGLGRITDTCVPDNGDVAVRKFMNMTISVDHKIANGAYAAEFLDFTRKLLEDTSNFD
ncbi:MAG: dihydrolipoamide acetyltransferase family protein [Phycisphaerae bacterium]|jgi:pyruvate dehydrogenase E2 component (dihydrolipoamide acetyltransferase)